MQIFLHENLYLESLGLLRIRILKIKRIYLVRNTYVFVSGSSVKIHRKCDRGLSMYYQNPLLTKVDRICNSPKYGIMSRENENNVTFLENI